MKFQDLLKDSVQDKVKVINKDTIKELPPAKRKEKGEKAGKLVYNKYDRASQVKVSEL